VHLDVEVVVAQQVGGLEVAVQDAVRVQVQHAQRTLTSRLLSHSRLADLRSRCRMPCVCRCSMPSAP
jgi:hypothetical protein